MTSHETARSLRETNSLPDGPAIERRIDPPHLAEVHVPGDTELTEAASAVLNIVQLRQHAAQLAGHLDSVRTDLDRREAELNARLAEADNQMRAAKLWLRERDEELAGKMAALELRQKTALEDEQRVLAERAGVDKRLDEIARREHEIEEAKLALERRELAGEQAALELARRRSELMAEVQRRQQQIDAREQAIMDQSHHLYKSIEQRRLALEEDHQRQLVRVRLIAQEAYQDELQRANAALGVRNQQLTDAEALLADSQQQLREEQDQLRQAWQRHEIQTSAQREGLARRQHELDDEWRDRQDTLAARSEQLDSRQAAMDQVRNDVAAQHREALELRLASEELWIRISETAPAAGLEQSLARIRERLAESYRSENASVIRQREEIDELNTRVAEQYARLAAEKKELGVWVRQRQQEIEAQAQRLVAREQQLDDQQSQMERMQRQWEDERRAYQSEIRSLLSQARGQRVAA